MPAPNPPSELVGRERLLERLSAAVDRTRAGNRSTVLLGGEAGIGKTALLRAAARLATAQGVHVMWGTGIDLAGAPGFWPWTQAIDGLIRSIGVERALELAGDDAVLVATIAPSLGAVAVGELTERDRLLAVDATSRFLERAASVQPILVILDDLHWADDSSLALLEFVVAAPHPAPLGLMGAYRHDELSLASRARLERVATHAEQLRVRGIEAAAVAELVAQVAGRAIDSETAAAIHQRTGGHPYFVREVALLGDAASGDQVPGAVRDAIARRVAHLPPAVIAMLEAGAVSGVVLQPDVVAAALGVSTLAIERAARAAVEAGLLVDADDATRFAHDLLREAILDQLDVERRVSLHQAVGAALEDRAERGGDVAPAELARHFVAAIPLEGTGRAVHWAMKAATADLAGLAFTEAASRLSRLRAAAADAGIALADRDLVEVLLTEADARSRGGGRVDARGLLRHAADVAERLDDPSAIARVAIAAAQLGARFATRRDEAVVELEAALAVVAGNDDHWEARLAATLARELQHSVPEDRPRALPLSKRALALGRRSGDAGTVLECLLARHDVLWTPGTAAERSDIAQEIVTVARSAGDREHHAQGLLLLANARLELGSAAWSADLDSCLEILATLGGVRHRYTTVTREVCRALLLGDLNRSEALIEDGLVLGERILEPDAGNVFMSQRLELVRARGDADELRDFAARAVAHWVGAPVHAHSVAAGFLARAGDLDGARAHAATVVQLGTWRADRSYLWSVFVRELAQAAIALDDAALCSQLLEDLDPLSRSCGVNGAAVAFAGCLAHTAGLLAQHVGRGDAAALLADAAATYEQLGAAGWLAELRRETGAGADATTASMRRQGSIWHLRYGGHAATVPHTKGLGDLARLIAADGAELHALDLVGSDDRSGGGGPMVDGVALADYRRRLHDLDAAIEEATVDNDLGRRERAEHEREAIVDELGRVLGSGGRARSFANHPGERARKAVSARIRDAIRKLEPELPELATHLEQSIVTGAWCRYRPGDEPWEIGFG